MFFVFTEMYIENFCHVCKILKVDNSRPLVLQESTQCFLIFIFQVVDCFMINLCSLNHRKMFLERMKIRAAFTPAVNVSLLEKFFQ